MHARMMRVGAVDSVNGQSEGAHNAARERRITADRCARTEQCCVSQRSKARAPVRSYIKRSFPAVHCHPARVMPAIGDEIAA